MPDMSARYRIWEKWGEDSLGIVYGAYNTTEQRRVDLRVLPEALVADSQRFRRIREQAHALHTPAHPGICAIYEIGEFCGHTALAMEPVPRDTLRYACAGRTLPSTEIVSLGSEITAILQAMAEHNLVHGYLTADNIFYDSDGRVKISFFGLAVPVVGTADRQEPLPVADINLEAATAGENDAPARELSRDGSVADTAAIPAEYRLTGSDRSDVLASAPIIRAPEQILGEAPDARSDLFALGAILYELASGQPAFNHTDATTLAQDILTCTPPPPLSINTELWPRLSDLITQLLEKDPALRCQSAADVHATLSRLQRDYRLTQEIFQESRSTHASSAKNESQAVIDAAVAAVTTVTPSPDDSTRPARHPAAHASLWRRRPVLTIVVSGLIILTGALALLRALTRPEYIHCIEFSGFAENAPNAAGLSAPIIGFILRQTLEQYPDIRVLTPEELSRLTQTMPPRPATTAEAQPSLLERITPWRRATPEPAGRLRGRVSESRHELVVDLECVFRGHRKQMQARFASADEFLERGADTLARQIIHFWYPDDARAQLENYHPAAQLLSARWDAVSHYFRGAQAWDRLDINAAAQELQTALTLDPDLAAAHLALGEVRIFQNQWDAAQSEILAARRRAIILTEVDQERVEAFLARVFGKPFDERRHFQRVIELQPHKKENYYELAESYFHTADADEAITHYLKAIELDPDYARAWNHLAYCYSWKGDHARAIAAGKKYLELDGSANAYDSLGDAYMAEGDYIRAGEMKRKALELDARINYATRTLAFIDLTYGRFSAARDKLQALLEITEDNTQTAQYYADLGFLYYRVGRLDEAEDMCRFGLQRMADLGQYDVPHDELLWINGLIALERRDLSAARADRRQLEDILQVGAITAENYKPAYKYWLHLDAAILAEEGKISEAVSHINDLKFISAKLGYWSTPYEYAFFMDAVGRLYEKMNFSRQAEDSFREALAYNRNFPTAWLHLADCRLRQGEREEARVALARVSDNWQDRDNTFPDTALIRRLNEALAQ